MRGPGMKVRGGEGGTAARRGLTAARWNPSHDRTTCGSCPSHIRVISGDDSPDLNVAADTAFAKPKQAASWCPERHIRVIRVTSESSESHPSR